MDNPNLDETQPGQTPPEQPEESSHLDETLRIPVEHLDPGLTMPMKSLGQEEEHPDPGATMPMKSLGQEEELPDPGATMPMKFLGQEDEPPDPGATLPISLPGETDEPGGLEETRLTPLNLDETPPGFDATIPPPPGAEFPGSFPPPEQLPKKPKWKSMRYLTLFGILGLFVIALLSALSGYWSGISARNQAASAEAVLQAKEQYDLALANIDNQEYDLARQRLEYVIQLDPNYPGVTDKLAAVLLELRITATPTFVPTPTLTPTPDIRGEEELFSQAQQSLYNSDWTTAINNLLTLRKKNPEYQAIRVDGLLYTAHRNRGKDKILKDGDLEGGIYDLTLAERFGPLDADSKSYLTWARLYILGASFWDVDWSQAVYYFGQVAPALPNLRDGSGWTATERYRLALINYGDALAGRREFCAAVKQYEQALAYGADAGVQQSYQTVLEKCEGAKPTQPPDAAPQEPTPVPEEPLPEQPTPEP